MSKLFFNDNPTRPKTLINRIILNWSCHNSLRRKSKLTTLPREECWKWAAWRRRRRSGHRRCRRRLSSTGPWRWTSRTEASTSRRSSPSPDVEAAGWGRFLSKEEIRSWTDGWNLENKIDSWKWRSWPFFSLEIWVANKSETNFLFH